MKILEVITSTVRELTDLRIAHKSYIRDLENRNINLELKIQLLEIGE